MRADHTLDQRLDNHDFTGLAVEKIGDLAMGSSKFDPKCYSFEFEYRRDMVREKEISDFFLEVLINWVLFGIFGYLEKDTDLNN